MQRAAGQAFEIGKLIGGLIIGALMYMFLFRPFEQLDSTATEQLSNQTALDGLSNTQTVFAPGYPLAIVLVSAIGLIMVAIHNRRGGV